MSNRRLLIVLSGPSAAGKDSILARLKAQGCPFHYTITATTRPRREREVDGRDYYFYSSEQFAALVDHDGLLEHACVYGYRYGVPRPPVVEALRRGEDVIVRTDIRGAISIRLLAPGAVLIFVAPPTIESLEVRLRLRHTEPPEAIALRLSKAREEMAAISSFDYAVVNREGELDRCVETVKAIITAERHRVTFPALGLV